MKQAALFAIILGLFGTCFANDTSNSATLRQDLGGSCEITQQASVVSHAGYVSLVIAGTAEEVFSPELNKNDRLVVRRDLPSSVLKLLRKSGFRVEKSSATSQDPAPQVLRKNEHAQCPTTEQALRVAAQHREQRRHELQSTLHRPGVDHVTPPIAVSSPPPSAEEQGSEPGGAAKQPDRNSTKTKYQGIALLSAVVATDGNVEQVKVVRSLRADLDQRALEAVKNWKFRPATKDGLPVPVIIDIEVNFRLY